MEHSNPYAAPATIGSNQTVLHDDAVRLLGIAKAQRGLMLCIMSSFVSLGLLFALGLGDKWIWIVFVASVLSVVSGLGSFVFLIILTYRLSGVLLAVIYGFTFLIPLVGLLVMFVMSGKASRLLKEAGFKIGLLGADIAKVREAVESANRTASA